MKQVLYVIIILIAILIIIYFIKIRPTANQSLQQKEVTSVKKPVILLIIDSLMDEPLKKAVNDGRAPALKYLIDHGYYVPDLVSSYPTMSVTIDSTLLTGTYSDKHRVPGLVWYDEKEKRFVSYGSARKEVFKLGTKQVIEDCVYHLNHSHLNRDVKTIHERLAENGLQSASINALVYRGVEKKTLRLSETLSKLDIMPDQLRIETPRLFSYGTFAQFNPKNNRHNDLWESYGFNNQFSASELKYLIQNEKLPAFTIAYFPDLDKEVHKKGPVHHIGAIEKVDKQLQDIFNTYESWDIAIEDNVWIAMGDSGQAEVKSDKNQSLIDLKMILRDYRIHNITEPIKEDDQLVLGLNERMTFIYILDPNLALDEIVQHLKWDERIQIIAWKQGNDIHVMKGGKEGKLIFHPDGEYQDEYDQSWHIEGDGSILDLTDRDRTIRYGDYPDGLARLYSSLHSHSGKYLVVDAKPGYEFVGEGSPTHPGGAAHGSLHKQDSFIPMIVTGTETKPKHRRIIDLQPWILQMIQEEA